MFLTNHNSAFLLHDVRVVKNVASLSSLLLGFTHVIRLALGGQAKSEHGYRIELITYHSY